MSQIVNNMSNLIRYITTTQNAGGATHVDQVIPDNCFAEGVPAVIKKDNITEEDRLDYFGVLPSGWTRYEAEKIKASIRKKKGIQ